MINIRKRNNLYEYRFEAGKVNGKRKQISKCGFKTKKEAYIAGQRAYAHGAHGDVHCLCKKITWKAKNVIKLIRFFGGKI